MIDKTSQISLTLLQRGESLATAGAYKEAVITVENPTKAWGEWNQITSTKWKCETGETVDIVEPMVIIKEPVFNEVTINVNLGIHFIEGALEKPIKPRQMNHGRWLRTDEGKIAQIWNKLSDEDRLGFAITQYADSQNCDIKTWTLL